MGWNSEITDLHPTYRLSSLRFWPGEAAITHVLSTPAWPPILVAIGARLATDHCRIITVAVVCRLRSLRACMATSRKGKSE